MLHYTQDDTAFFKLAPRNSVEFYHNFGPTSYELLPWRCQ